MTKRLQLVFEELPRLSGAELRQVLTRTRALLQYTPGQHVSVEAVETTPEKQVDDYEHEWLVDGIRDELRKRSLPHRFSLERIHRTREWIAFRKAAVEVEPWLAGLATDMERPQKVALSGLAASCLATSISSFVPVCLESLLRFYGRVPGAFERAFPEYVVNGWVKFLVRSA